VLFSQGSRSYAYSIGVLSVSPFVHLYKTTSCEVEVAARQSEIKFIRVSAGALVVLRFLLRFRGECGRGMQAEIPSLYG
jgi:hypothetical protein